jgi:hypothetical protein
MATVVNAGTMVGSWLPKRIDTVDSPPQPSFTSRSFGCSAESEEYTSSA